MILTPHADEVAPAARAVATVAHPGVEDRAGNEYIDHPRRVAAHVAEYGPEFAAVTWPYEVIED